MTNTSRGQSVRASHAVWGNSPRGGLLTLCAHTRNRAANKRPVSWVSDSQSSAAVIAHG